MLLRNKNENGRSMIEMLGVLGIMAVITVLSIAAYTMAMKNVKVNNFKNDVSVIKMQLKNSSKTLPSASYPEQVSNFENLFVLTGFYKENTTPFGGQYRIWGAPGGYTLGLYYLNAAVSSKDCALIRSQDYGDEVTIEDDSLCLLLRLN